MTQPSPYRGRRAFLQQATAAAVGLAAPGIGIIQARATSASRIVETQYGKLQGNLQQDVCTFKGIRYGGPTGGANRFLPPTTPRSWAGVQPASSFGNSAPQSHNAHPSPLVEALNDWYEQIQPIDEDCLFLNVFAPADGKPRPVMVWLHGGGWSSCAGTAPGFDGTNLARYGDVVVVTINHRLGVFGYLGLGAGEERFADAGNAGTLDMVAALRWVRDNIAAFGGDPHNVTIFGQSGGAAKVTALLGMPAARGLFHKAIVQSCSGGMHLQTTTEAARQTRALANQFGMQQIDASALQALPMAALLAASKAISDPFRPIVDDRNFHANPFDEVPTPISAAIPLLIGNAATEATLFLGAKKQNRDIDLPTVNQKLSRFLRVDAVQTTQIIDTYRSALPDRATPFHLYAQVVTDYVYRRNTTQIAALKATQQAAVYDYVFDWKTPVFGGIFLSPHTSEVPFVFGTTRQAVGLVGTGTDLSHLTRVVMGAWASFAHTGNPNTPGLPIWPVYTQGSRSTMLLDMQSTVASDPGGAQRRSLDALPFFDYGMLQNLLRA